MTFVDSTCRDAGGQLRYHLEVIGNVRPQTKWQSYDESGRILKEYDSEKAAATRYVYDVRFGGMMLKGKIVEIRARRVNRTLTYTYYLDEYPAASTAPARKEPVQNKKPSILRGLFILNRLYASHRHTSQALVVEVV